MADLSIQFHALPEEILPLLASLAEESQAFIMALTFSPFCVERAEPSMLASLLESPRIDRIAFTCGAPVLAVRGMNDFLDKNSDVLLVDIGRLGDSGLRESWVTARTADSASMRRWRHFARRIRAITRTGVAAVNAQTGAMANLREHRFSAGAKELERSGVPMLPAAGTSRLKFAE
jgi:hypothetical protein